MTAILAQEPLLTGRFHFWGIAGACGLHALMVLITIVRDHAVLDEFAHLASGVHQLETGDTALYAVNPPYVRLLAAVPVWLHGASVCPFPKNVSPYRRPEFSAGGILARNGNAQWYLLLGRLACCLFGCLTCIVGSLWCSQLLGRRSGITFAVLASTCPHFVSYSGKILPDQAATALAFLCSYIAWHWSRDRSWRTAMLYGITLGLAVSAKTTCLILVGLVPVLVVVDRRWRAESTTSSRRIFRSRFAHQIVAANIVALVVVNGLYGFDGVCTSLGEYRFSSRLLGANSNAELPANRLSGSCLRGLPLPLPRHYVQGIDIQLSEFDRQKWSYLCGEQQYGGGYHYYIVVAIVKRTVGSLILSMMGVAQIMGVYGKRISVMSLLWPLGVGIAFFLCASSQAGFSRHGRYCLPALPFFYTLATVPLANASWGARRVSVSAICVVAHVVRAISAIPHSFAYFNEAIGGPRNGWLCLADSNIDWGQDFGHLERWYKSTPSARPFFIAYFGDALIPTQFSNKREHAIPSFCDVRERCMSRQRPLRRGWYAVSVNNILGYRHYTDVHRDMRYFQWLRPVYCAGYSIYVYRIDECAVQTIERNMELWGSSSVDCRKCVLPSAPVQH